MPGQPKPNKSGPQRVCDSCVANTPDLKRQVDQQAKDKQAKAAGAVLCVEGAGTAERNGYYKENGAPASLPLADDDIMMISSCARSHAGNQ